MPRLAALAILQAGNGHLTRSTKPAGRQLTAPAQAAGLIEELRAAEVSLIYDPATKTLRADASNAVPVSVG